jgi:3-methyladenine DNA glycosylase Mpg
VEAESYAGQAWWVASKSRRLVRTDDNVSITSSMVLCGGSLNIYLTNHHEIANFFAFPNDKIKRDPIG